MREGRGSQLEYLRPQDPFHVVKLHLILRRQRERII